MPTYRFTLLYYDSNSGLAWSLTGHRVQDNPDDLFNLAVQPFNSKYMLCCADTVSPLACRISDVSVYRDMFLRVNSDFTAQNGAISALPTEISSCAFLRIFGPTNAAGSSAWRFHGISETLVSGNEIAVGGGPWLLFVSTAQDLFWIYRPTSPSGLLPIINPPVIGINPVLYPTLYTRRLGRPITLAGQQRAYHRTVP